MMIDDEFHKIHRCILFVAFTESLGQFASSGCTGMQRNASSEVTYLLGVPSSLVLVPFL